MSKIISFPGIQCLLVNLLRLKLNGILVHFFACSSANFIVQSHYSKDVPILIVLKRRIFFSTKEKHLIDSHYLAKQRLLSTCLLTF